MKKIINPATFSFLLIFSLVYKVFSIDDDPHQEECRYSVSKLGLSDQNIYSGSSEEHGNSLDDALNEGQIITVKIKNIANSSAKKSIDIFFDHQVKENTHIKKEIMKALRDKNSFSYFNNGDNFSIRKMGGIFEISYATCAAKGKSFEEALQNLSQNMDMFQEHKHRKKYQERGKQESIKSWNAVINELMKYVKIFHNNNLTYGDLKHLLENIDEYFDEKIMGYLRYCEYLAL